MEINCVQQATMLANASTVYLINQNIHRNVRISHFNLLPRVKINFINHQHRTL